MTAVLYSQAAPKERMGSFINGWAGTASAVIYNILENTEKQESRESRLWICWSTEYTERHLPRQREQPFDICKHSEEPAGPPWPMVPNATGD
jgi:hypothetical protein